MNKILPENVLKCMSPEARRPLGKAGVTSAEAVAKHEYGKERKLHQQICQLLNIRNYVYIHSRTDKRATNGAGVPDFIIFRRDQPELCVEVKYGMGSLSEDQMKWAIKYAASTDRLVEIVRSLDEVKTLLDAGPTQQSTSVKIDYKKEGVIP
jgi:hypothetical protein